MSGLHGFAQADILVDFNLHFDVKLQVTCGGELSGETKSPPPRKKLTEAAKKAAKKAKKAQKSHVKSSPAKTTVKTKKHKAPHKSNKAPHKAHKQPKSPKSPPFELPVGCLYPYCVGISVLGQTVRRPHVAELVRLSRRAMFAGDCWAVLLTSH